MRVAERLFLIAAMLLISVSYISDYQRDLSVRPENLDPRLIELGLDLTPGVTKDEYKVDLAISIYQAIAVGDKGSLGEALASAGKIKFSSMSKRTDNASSSERYRNKHGTSVFIVEYFDSDTLERRKSMNGCLLNEGDAVETVIVDGEARVYWENISKDLFKDSCPDYGYFVDDGTPVMSDAVRDSARRVAEELLYPRHLLAN